MLLRIQHETKLSYSDPVAETVFEVRMAPPSDEDQTNLGYRLRITPSAPVTSYRDGFGNRVDLFNILTPYQRAGRSRRRRSCGPTAGAAEARLAEVDVGADRPTPRARGARVPPAQPAGQPLARSSTRSSPACPGREGRLDRRDPSS